MNEMRRDPITRKWVIIQHDLPVDEVIEKIRTAVEKERKRWNKDAACGFCPGNEQTTRSSILEFARGVMHYRTHVDDWEIRVIPHRNPVFQIEGNVNRRPSSGYDAMDAIGAHEVIVESRKHADWDQLARDEVRNILAVYHERVNDLSRDDRFGHLFLYKNYGPGSYSRIIHPHSTLIASPSVPERIRRELEFTRKHYQMKERCLFCDVISNELRRRDSSGAVHLGDRFITISPYFAAHPFETWILPRQHDSDFRHLPPDRLDELASAIQRNLIQTKAVIGPVSYSLFLFTRPNKIWGSDRDYWTTVDEDYHWHLKFIPRLPKIGGFHRSFSAGSGYLINQVPPETAAQILRSAVAVPS